MIGTPSQYSKSKLIGVNSPEKLESGSYFMNITSEGEIVGSLYVKPYNNTAYIIRDVFVSEKHRGKGLGAQLISGILEHLAPKQKSIYLYVDPKNTTAINLYKKHKFKLIKKEGAWGDKYKYSP